MRIIIVVAPDIGTVEVYPDDFSSPVEVVQNTVSGLFHEIGERQESNEKIRGSVIIYENYARRISGLHERPTTLTTLTHKLPGKYIKAYETCFINLVVYFNCEYNQCSDYMARALRRLRKV